jgi:hypothetical protein
MDILATKIKALLKPIVSLLMKSTTSMKLMDAAKTARLIVLSKNSSLKFIRKKQSSMRTHLQETAIKKSNLQVALIRK